MRMSDLTAKGLGVTVGVSDWLTIEQSMIDSFAETTRDPQFIHIDPVRAAAETPFGGTIAHGFLTMSLMTHLLEQSVPPFEGERMSINYGFDRLRFVAPVRAGARIRGQFAVKSFEERVASREYQIVWDCRIEIEGADKPAIVADWIARHYF